MHKPPTEQYPDYFQKYVQYVKDEELAQAFDRQLPEAHSFFNSIGENQSLNRYAPGKWDLREVLQHIIDTERIFSYRALCIARRDAQTLPSFDEVQYGINSMGSRRPWSDLVEEFLAVRSASACLFKSLPVESLQIVGPVGNYRISPLALGYISLGHVYHHINIMKERYLGK
ncbi:MAG: DinB family protein [Bacteroidota bacterium]|nr:DinB family protein [Bacteroidota bacterium]